MKVALVQIDVRVGDLARNAEAVLAAAREARARGADVVVFPELVLTGYPPRDLLLDAGFVDDAIGTLARIAVEAGREALPPLVVGAIARSTAPARPGHPGLHDVAAVLEGGRVAACVAKRLLPSYDVFHETRWFDPGSASSLLPVTHVPVGLLVCEDLWAPGYPADPGAELVASGARALLCISASPFRPGALAERIALARRHAVPLVYVNAVGANDEIVFDGGSFVLDATGGVQALLPRFAEALEVVDLGALGAAAVPPPEPEPDPEPDGPRELFSALVLGVRDFARKNGIRPAWVGVSGGIDSALVLAIAVEALGRENVRGVALPSRFTDPRSTDAARALAERLGVALEVLPIEPLHAAAEAMLGPLVEEAATGSTSPGASLWPENLQARLRMVLLMALVNARGGLLLNTSNKTEIALGYGTLYGDMAGALAVIGDLTKPEVYAVARFLDRSRDGLFPPFVLERPPTAELRADQVDPFDYARIAPLAEALVRGLPPPADAEPTEVARVAALLRASEHKRFQAGIVLKVSARAFGTGRMIPVTRA